MRSLILIALWLYGSWELTDLASDNAWFSVAAPVGVFLGLIALGFWLVLVAGVRGRVGGGHPLEKQTGGGFDDLGGPGGD